MQNVRHGCTIGTAQYKYATRTPDNPAHPIGRTVHTSLTVQDSLSKNAAPTTGFDAYAICPETHPVTRRSR